MSYEVELNNIRSMRNNEVIDNLSFTSDDIILAKAMTQSSTKADYVLLTCNPNPTTGEAVIEYQVKDQSYFLSSYTRCQDSSFKS
jgi:hypothetical protein